jgi:hypothetical protein
MDQFKNILRVIGQSVLIIVFGLSGSLLFEFRIPGHQIFTDNDAGVLGLVYLVFIITGIGLLFNSLIFLVDNHWKKYRIGVLVFIFGFALAVFLPRDVIKWTFLGEKKMQFTSMENPELIWVKLELYKNNDFLCSTSDAEMTVENLGKYVLESNTLKLSFKNEITEKVKKNYKTLTENIGTNYKIFNDTLICIDCESEIKLKKN